MIGCYTPTVVYIIIYVEVYVLVLTHIKDRQCVRLYFVVSKTNLGICYYVSNNQLQGWTYYVLVHLSNINLQF